MDAEHVAHQRSRVHGRRISYRTERARRSSQSFGGDGPIRNIDEDSELVGKHPLDGRGEIRERQWHAG